MKAEPVKRELGKLRNLPTKVDDWRVEVGADATGDDAVWVWVVLRNADASFTVRDKLRNLVRKTVDRLSRANSTIVYVRFNSTAEVAAA